MTATTIPTSPASRLRTYASFVRFEHTLFSLPLILAGIFSSAGIPMSPERWAWIAVAAVGARTSAMALNRLIDRRLDALNPRTRSRELPAGTVKVSEAVTLLVGSTAAYLGACYTLGPWYLEVSPIPLAVFAIYPYLKRWTPLCHFGVGLALALSPLAGYASAHPDLTQLRPSLWLAGFAFFWVSGFDIIYATLDEAFDREHGVHSMVAWLGRPRALRVSGLLHLLAFGCLVMAARYAWASITVHPVWSTRFLPLRLGALMLGVCAVLLFLEQRWASNVDLAFFKVNVWVGVAVLLMILVLHVGT